MFTPIQSATFTTCIKNIFLLLADKTDQFGISDLIIKKIRIGRRSSVVIIATVSEKQRLVALQTCLQIQTDMFTASTLSYVQKIRMWQVFTQ